MNQKRYNTLSEHNRSSLKFEGIDSPVTFIDCEELHAPVKAIFRDFRVERAKNNLWEDSQITLRKVDKGYERSSHWLDEPVVHYDPVDSVCDLTVDLIHAFASDHPGFLCLHSAAALFKKGLFLFPSTYRAGKSTLSLFLAYNGVQLFTDDALPVTSNYNEGMATGLYPRLRLPLPEAVNENFRKYIKKRIVLRNNRYCYISLDQDEQPPLGTTAPIRGIILLNLDLNINAPSLLPIGKKDAIKEMILRNFARQNKALDIVERIYTIAEGADCYKLTYSNPDRASKLLIKHFN